MVQRLDEHEISDPWIATLRETQNEIAALSPHPYYLAAYRQLEFSFWPHIPRWIYLDVLERKPRNCLDVGCAYGTLLLYTKKLSNCDAYGIDFIDKYLSPAVVAKYDLHFCLNNIELDPFPWSCSYDSIIFTEVLEHLNFFAVPTLEKLGSLLSTDGKLYLSTPDAAQWGKTRKYYPSYKVMPMPSAELRTQVVDDHVWQFSQDELFEVIDAAGLEILRFDIAIGNPNQHFNLTLQRGNR
jgi:SAM-dependent methyltransferase